MVTTFDLEATCTLNIFIFSKYIALIHLLFQIVNQGFFFYGFSSIIFYQIFPNFHIIFSMSFLIAKEPYVV